MKVLYLEAITDNPEIVDANIREVKLSSPDYKGVPGSEAKDDFLKRIEFYNSTYTSIQDTALNFIKLINMGEEIIVNRIKGYLPTSMVYYLTNLHISRRTIYLCRV
jgi:hypothetical protein